ncbi:MAG TPA: RNA 3'-terminal phosphate cyclase [Nitrospirota bacterium]|nr:RNA 3'-terminal phosphate cyclase [Nitrospirota bacterium]
MIVISGSYGEGGGQILRSSLSLSALLGEPVKILNIRRNRPKPGLRPQHLTSVLAVKELSRGEVTGAEVGSTELAFVPRDVRPGAYDFDVSRITGSAGSVTLILQTILPVLALSHGQSRVTLAGGTHVPWSPPFHFIERCFLPAVGRLGINATVSIERWGFYPKGGGRVVADVTPSAKLVPVDLTSRGRLVGVKLISAAANLPEGIAQRQADAAKGAVAGAGVEPDVEIINAPSPGQGTFVYISAEFENVTLGFSALGERGKRAETVGLEAARDFLGFMEMGACVDERLADQLVLYMALAEGSSRMSVERVTSHLMTNIWVVGQFLPDVHIKVEGEEGSPGIVEVVSPGLRVRARG